MLVHASAHFPRSRISPLSQLFGVAVCSRESSLSRSCTRLTSLDLSRCTLGTNAGPRSLAVAVLQCLDQHCRARAPVHELSAALALSSPPSTAPNFSPSERAPEICRIEAYSHRFEGSVGPNQVSADAAQQLRIVRLSSLSAQSCRRRAVKWVQPCKQSRF